MRKNQENKFTMYKAVDTYLDENLVIVQGITELSASHLQLKGKYLELKTKNDESLKALSGKAVSKLVARMNAINSSLAISGGLYGYAKKNKNTELETITNIQKSSLDKMRDTELTTALEAIADLAEAHISSLEPFGVTPAKAEEFREKINLYDASVGKKETGMIRKKGAKKSLRTLFTEADDILVTMDKYIDGLKNDHGEFVSNYKEARFIMNMGIRHKKVVVVPEGGSS